MNKVLKAIVVLAIIVAVVVVGSVILDFTHAITGRDASQQAEQIQSLNAQIVSLKNRVTALEREQQEAEEALADLQAQVVAGRMAGSNGTGQYAADGQEASGSQNTGQNPQGAGNASGSGQIGSSGHAISPDLVAFMDAYEAFADEYLAFVKDMDSSDLSSYTRLASLIQKEADFAEKMAAWEAKDLTTAEAAYMAERSARIGAKLIQAAAAMY